MVDQAVTTVAVDDKVLIEIGFLRSYRRMRRGWLRTLSSDVPCSRHLAPAAFLFIGAQRLVITLFVACYHRQQVMHAAPQVPLKKRASTLWVYVKVLLIALNDQFVLAVPVSVGKLVALPGPRTEPDSVSSVLGLDQVMVYC